MYFPDSNLDTVLLLPRDAFLRHNHMPTFEEAKVIDDGRRRVRVLL